MNEILNKANKWLNELGIRTEFHPTCIKVRRNDVATISDEEEMLKEIREAVGCKRLVWANKSMDWFELECL